MIKKLLFILCILNFIQVFTYAQGKGKVRGTVVDSLSGEPLAFSNIYIKNLGVGVSANERGFFIISALPVNNFYTAEVSYVGYKTKTINFSVSNNKITDLKIELAATNVEIETIEKVGKRVYGENVTDIGIQKINARKLTSMPRGVEPDVFRVVQYLPGVQSSSDVSAKFHVRGGASNQNQFLIDGIEIYNPFHALGLFGIIDPEVISNIQLHIGGFSAEHTGKISSVMNMFTKDGNKQYYKGSLSSSFMTVKAHAEGPYKSGSFIVSARKSYSNKILDKFLEDDDTPIDFYDVFAKVNYSNEDLMPNGYFSFLALGSYDKIDNQSKFLPDVNWSNSAFGIKWTQFTTDPLYYVIQVSRSEFKGNLIANNSGIKPIENIVVDYMARFDVSYVYDSKDELSGGMKLNEISTDLFLENSLGLRQNIGPEDVRINTGIYLNYKFMRWHDLIIDLGARLNLVGLSRESEYSVAEPRVSFSYNLSDMFTFKSSWGVYQQEITTLSDEDEVITYFEPWLITPKYLDPTRSTHYVAGIEFRNGNNIALDIEGYLKNVENITGLNEQKFLASDPDLVSGSSKAYGLDAMLRYSNQLFNFTTSYSLGYVKKKINGIEYSPRFDIRNSLKIVLESSNYKGWRVSLAWIYNSGIPFTQIGGYYNKYYFDNYFNIFSTTGSSKTTPLLGPRNVAKLPDYHRLDLNVSKSLMVSKFKLYIDLSLLNVYDRANLFYFNRDTGKRINMLPFLPTFTIKLEI